MQFKSIYFHRPRLELEDPRPAALRVPGTDSPTSRVGQLSKAVSTSSTLIGTQLNQRPVDGYSTIGGIQWKSNRK